MKTITFPASLWIGIWQMAAIIPGVSRSGVTMTAGLSAGLNRESAARFSFLLSTPIILGAALVKLPHLVAHPSDITTNFIVAVIISCITGFASIGFLLRFLQVRGFVPFTIYRLALGAFVIMMVLIR
jgi:undecaprenyl-diphosphatase